ncbi:MAG: pyruvate oxidase [Bacteroidota bacterium]|nr:pyruvate oxidase [Bacteroidota bacterium]
MVMNVCDVLLDVLTQYGVKYIFGIPGDAINELIESIRKQDTIKFIHVMHEESGAFAASAQAKLTGELAVCVGTAGPGAIHLLNGLYDAKADHAPVLAITGQVETEYLGTSYQQEVALKALFEDVSIYNQVLLDPRQLPEIAALACQVALAQKGVSHLTIPANIATQKVSKYVKGNPVLRQHYELRPSKEELQHAAELINNAEKICILAGIGARNGVKELLKVAAHVKAPIIKALRGKDILPDENAFTLGGIGLLGTEPAYKAMKECDLLMIAGSDFPYSGFYPGKHVPVIQIDENASHIGRRHPVSVALVGDCKLTLDDLLPLLSEKKNNKFLTDMQDEMIGWLKHQNKMETSKDVPIHPQTLTRTISDHAADDAIIVCDTGTVTVWGARHFYMKATQRFTLSGGLASMAYGLPGAIGAQLLYPGKQVIALCGDGGFAMLMADFATAVRYKLPVKIFIFNNSKLGLIQMEEEAKSGNPEYETHLFNPDYAKFAEACGATGYTVREAAELKGAVVSALSAAEPCIVNVFVKPDELTMPPNVTIGEAVNYIKAKITEFISDDEE